MRGSTLIELVVTLLVLGLVSGVAALAVGSLRRPPADRRIATLEQARAAAARTGRPVTIESDSAPMLLLPDGRALGAGVDPLTGEVIGATP